MVVTFEMSGAQFGIGLPYGPMPVPGNPRTVLLPPLGTVEVKIHWTPVTSGHYCVRVKIDIPGANYPPIYTQRNLDVAEDLRPGIQDDLRFAVSNPTAAPADIRLVVINTCPGWTAWVDPTELLGMAPGEIRNATLSVTPPVDRPLGTACHIDVQGWIGDRLIGGIRKLDVPPVHLPEANPPWMEREIVVIPDPPVLGVPGQLCVDLQNPTGVARTVNVQFSVAAFGAGIPFTPVGSLPGVVLPPNSITRHCIAWTPTPVSNGNLHRCIQVRLSQANFVDQLSQRNVDLRRLRVRTLEELLALHIPFSIGNPAPYPQALKVEPKIVGLQGIEAIIDPDPPLILPGGAVQDFTLRFVQANAAADESPVTALEQYGDVTQAEVAVFLDDQPASGFNVAIELPNNKIAYVFRSDTPAAAQFKALLEANGFTVALIPLPAVLTTDFAVFDLVIVAHDTGYLDEWPSGVGGVSAEAAHIAAANKPVVGLGEGGYAYFGKADQALGWPHGWHGPLAAVWPVNTGQTYWHVPYDLGTPPPSPLPLYGNPVPEVGIYLPGMTAVLPLGLEPADKYHAPLLAEEDDCDQLWGFGGPPEQMTAKGRKLFVNAVTYGLTIAGRCVPPKTPPDRCVQVTKTAVPPAGTAVAVGGTIKYEIKYTVANLPGCALQRAVLTDKVPDGTLFIPGSASDGITPGADGVLQWNLGPLAPGATGSKFFKVVVGDAACRNQKTIINQAKLVTSLGTVMSNVVTHPVDCPPVIPDGTQPPYAEDEIQIYPYPLVTGQLTELSVRVRNLSANPQTVVVTFEMSGAQFGIGLPYGPMPVPGNPRTVLLPPLGTVEVKIHWTPVTSGHYCVRVKIDIPGANYPPIYTQRNLDVAEDLRPGIQDDLRFAVSNPTAAPADIRLVVINTCPGWTAWVDPTELLGMAPGEIRNATLSVTPPVDRPLGTACHIDVQGWIGDRLIGGIRKLDVPPVHLPEANPPWMEREIVVIPDPPVLGVPGQLCVDLQNPTNVPRTVNVQFSVAAFGAGIPFTPVGSLPGVVLPPNSITRHCIAWTPTPVSNGNLHRCIQVRISQANFVDQLSQRNVDLRRLRIRSLAELLALRIPFSLGNPAPFPQALRVEPRMVGLRGIQPIIDPVPPSSLPAGAVQAFTLRFVQANAAAGEIPVTALEQYGDVTQAEVAVFLDDEPVGGFSVVLDLSEKVYLPMIMR